jgi:hypothetical protein
VLDEWSKLVEADFQSASIAVECSLQSADAKLDLLVKMVKYMTDIANGLKAQNGENMIQMADKKACLSRQQREIEELKETNYVASQKLELIKTPEHAKVAKRKTLGDGTASTRNTSENLLDDLAQAKTDSAVSPVTNAGVVAPPVSTLPVAKDLHYNSQARQITEDKNVSLRARDVLQWLSSTGTVNPTDMKLSHIPTGAFKERASVIYTLDLAQLDAIPQERVVLANGRSHDKAIVMGAAETVEAKMLAKIFEFENSSFAINTSQRSLKTKSYNAFGSRFKAYKKEVKAKLHSNDSWQDQPLLEPDELHRRAREAAPGTPEDNTSIRGWTRNN